MGEDAAFEPARHALERPMIEVIPARAALPFNAEESGPFQDIQVFHHGRACEGRRKVRDEIAGGGGPPSQPLDDLAPGRIGQGLPNLLGTGERCL